MLQLTLVNLSFRHSIEELLPWLEPEQQHRIRQYVRVENAHLSLWGQLTVRSMLGARLGVPPQSLRIERTPYGKPYLAGRDDLHFSISHSGSWVACAVDNQPIGVDIEVHAPIDYSMITSRFFTRVEKEHLERLPMEERLEGFYDLWTLKESYVKAVGQGLSLPLDGFSVLDRRVEDYKLHCFRNEQHSLAVCTKQLLVTTCFEQENDILARLQQTQTLYRDGGIRNG